MDVILLKSLLFDFYGKLLTDKQRSCYEMYYFENLTLSEIGKEFNITMQAAGDIIRRTEKKLLDYEQKLGIIMKYDGQRQLAKEIFDALDDLVTDDAVRRSQVDAIKADVQRLLI